MNIDPRILEALRITRDLRYPVFRRGYAMGGAPSMQMFDPTTYYTPRTNTPADPFMSSPLDDEYGSQAVPTLHTGSSAYPRASIYPTAGSGVNVPRPPPPAGIHGLLGYATGMPPNLPMAYPGMNNNQFAGGTMGGMSGTGLKTGPGMGGRM